VWQAPPAVSEFVAKFTRYSRQGLDGSAFPGRAREREIIRESAYGDGAVAALVAAGAERTSPITAQALDAWVMGSNFVATLPFPMIARDVIAQAPSGRWDFSRKNCAFRIAASSFVAPASARA
jgi:hypothetical protein